MKVKNSKIQIITHIINGTTTVVKLEDRRTGVATLHPDDKFDEYIGFQVAYGRALGFEADENKRLSEYTIKELKEELKNRL